MMYKSCLAVCSLLILATIATPSQASGALWCNAEDANLKLEVESGVTHGMGSPFFNFKASAKLLFPNVEPDFRELKLDDKLVHSWLEGTETKLLFYTERQGDKPFGSVMITIKTSGNPEDEGDARGTYEVSYFEAERQQGEADGFTRMTGEVSCGGE